jgi:hypothetical protein
MYFGTGKANRKDSVNKLMQIYDIENSDIPLESIYMSVRRLEDEMEKSHSKGFSYSMI